jgi:hypothetical protein
LCAGHAQQLGGESPPPDQSSAMSAPVSTNGRRDDGSAERQAAWLSAAYHQAAALGVERAFWLFLPDALNTGYFGRMGLFDDNNAPRPAWYAYKAIDTSTAAGQCFLDMLGVFAEFETLDCERDSVGSTCSVARICLWWS